jgi:dihydrofolate reductase
MRTLAITQNVTADGAVEMLGDWFDPTAEDRQVTEAMNRFTERSDALLLGRRTFEDFRGFWPKQTDDRTGVTDELNRVQKYVVSSTMTDPQWQNSTILSGDWLARVAELKEQPGGDIGVTGSIRVCHADRGGVGRRVPALRLPRRAGARAAAVPRGVRGRPAPGRGRRRFRQRGHAPALRRTMNPAHQPRGPWRSV